MNRDKQLVVAVLPDFVIDLHEGVFSPLQTRDTAQAGGFARPRVTKQSRHPFTGQLHVQVQRKAGIAELQPNIDMRTHVQLQVL